MAKHWQEGKAQKTAHFPILKSKEANGYTEMSYPHQACSVLNMSQMILYPVQEIYYITQDKIKFENCIACLLYFLVLMYGFVLHLQD